LANTRFSKDGWWYLPTAVPLQAWSGSAGSRKLRFPDFMTTAQDGGKVSPTSGVFDLFYVCTNVYEKRATVLSNTANEEGFFLLLFVESGTEFILLRLCSG